MARQLEKCSDNEFKLLDPRSGDEIVFLYRSPTTEDRVRHQTRRYGRSGKKMISRSRSACIESATDVLTGIRDNDFIIGTEPLSSTPGNPGYRDDWKSIIKDMAGDLLLIMGHDLFEQKIGVEVLKDLQIVDEFDTGVEKVDVKTEDREEDIPPLAKSSGA